MSSSGSDRFNFEQEAAGSSGTVTSVTGTAPITVTGTATDPVVGISAATTLAAGSMSAADKTKLDGIAASATNTPLSSTTPANVGTAAIGVGATAARADHVHALPAVGTAGTFAYPTSMTTDAQGRISAITPGSAPASLASTTPADVGSAAVGIGTTAARADHVHGHGNQLGGSLHANAGGGSAGFMTDAQATQLAALPSALSLPVSVANGGTGSSTALANGRAIVSAGGKLVEGDLPLDVQVFSSPGTTNWTRPAYGSLVRVICIGGGGGGGSGRRGGTTNSYGGAGGGGGGYTDSTFARLALAATVSVTTGAGGGGGAATTTNTTNGSSGADGNPSSFGTWLKANGGTGGVGGANGSTATVATGGVGVWTGGSGAPTDGSIANAAAAAFAPTGGGAGGGVGGTGLEFGSSSSTVSNGQNYTAAAGGSGGSAGTAGTAPGAWMPGGGGGGGGGNTTGAGGAGGAGGSYGGGGGGGGGSNAGSNSGAGGAGANGVVIVVTYA